MSTPTVSDPTLGTDRSTHAAMHGNGLLADAGRLWEVWSGLARDRLRLAALETRLAGISLVTMLAAGVMIGMLLGSAWLGLVAAAILYLVGTGMAAGPALALGVLVNLVLAFLLVRVVGVQSRRLQWPATVRSLQADPSAAAVPWCETGDG